MSSSTYVIDIGTPDAVKILGIEHGRARLIAGNDSHIVVAFAGYSYNPGSRYSGLRSYVQAETTVYAIKEVLEGGRLRCTRCIDWTPRRTK